MYKSCTSTILLRVSISVIIGGFLYHNHSNPFNINANNDVKVHFAYKDKENSRVKKELDTNLMVANKEVVIKGLHHRSLSKPYPSKGRQPQVVVKRKQMTVTSRASSVQANDMVSDSLVPPTLLSMETTTFAPSCIPSLSFESSVTASLPHSIETPVPSSRPTATPSTTPTVVPTVAPTTRQTAKPTAKRRTARPTRPKYRRPMPPVASSTPDPTFELPPVLTTSPTSEMSTEKISMEPTELSLFSQEPSPQQPVLSPTVGETALSSLEPSMHEPSLLPSAPTRMPLPSTEESSLSFVPSDMPPLPSFYPSLTPLEENSDSSLTPTHESSLQPSFLLATDPATYDGTNSLRPSSLLPSTSPSVLLRTDSPIRSSIEVPGVNKILSAIQIVTLRTESREIMDDSAVKSFESITQKFVTDNLHNFIKINVTSVRVATQIIVNNTSGRRRFLQIREGGTVKRIRIKMEIRAIVFALSEFSYAFSDEISHAFKTNHTAYHNMLISNMSNYFFTIPTNINQIKNEPGNNNDQSESSVSSGLVIGLGIMIGVSVLIVIFSVLSMRQTTPRGRRVNKVDDGENAMSICIDSSHDCDDFFLGRYGYGCSFDTEDQSRNDLGSGD